MKVFCKGKVVFALIVLAVMLMVNGCVPPVISEQTTTQPATAASDAQTQPTEPAIPNFNETGYPIVNEPITLTVCGALGATTTTWKGNSLFTHLTEVTGIKFEIDEYASTAWNDRKKLIFAANELPDLFISAKFSAAELSMYGSEGQLIDLADLITQYAPNIQEAFTEYPQAKGGSTTRDGKIYALPIINPVPRDLHTRYWINTKWLQNVGKEVPTNLDELYDVLVAFKEQDANGNGDPNDEIPVSGMINANVDSIDGLILNALGINASQGKYYRVADKDGKVYIKHTAPGYKEYLKYMHKLFSEKLLDNDVFVQTNEQFNAKGKQGILGCFYSSASYITCGPELGYDYTQFDALTSSLNNTKMVTSGTGCSFGIGAITKVNKYPEATMRLLDYCYSEEGSRVNYYGEENVGWRWIDKSAGTWETIVPEGYESDNQHRSVVTAILGFPSWYRESFLNGQATGNAAWLNEMTAKYSQPYFVQAYPTLYFTQEENDILTPIENDLREYCNQMRAEFIIEGNIDEKWDEFVATIEKIGGAKVVEINQKVYDQYLEAMK